MTVEEGPPSAILPGDAAIDTIVDKARIRHCLGETPVHIDFAGRHAPTLVDDSLYPAVQNVPVGDRGDFR